MAPRRVVEIMSAWLVENFDPKLAQWFATRKDAVEPVRHLIEEEREQKDKVTRWALDRLYRGLESMDTPEAWESIDPRVLRLVVEMLEAARFVRHGRLRDKLGLARHIDEMARRIPDNGPCAMELRDIVQKFQSDRAEKRAPDFDQ